MNSYRMPDVLALYEFRIDYNPCPIANRLPNFYSCQDRGYYCPPTRDNWDCDLCELFHDLLIQNFKENSMKGKYPIGIYPYDPETARNY